MPPDSPGDRRIFHVLPAGEWEAAREAGRYQGSTRGATLADVGFVHCCFAEQVKAVAERLYPGAADLVALAIDPTRLTSEVRVEQLGQASEAFPHVYGPLDPTAVVAVVPLTSAGRLAALIRHSLLAELQPDNRDALDGFVGLSDAEPVDDVDSVIYG